VPAGAQVAAAVVAVEAQSTISFDRMYDLYWTHSPTDMIWVIISRREKKKKAKSRMPVILRNLAPDSTFDPRDAWAKEKARQVEEKEEQQATATAEAAAAAAAAKEEKGGKKNKGGKKGGGGGGQTGKLTKEDMIAVNIEKQRAKEVASDWEKLDNAAKSAKKGAVADVLSVKTVTKAGALRKLLMILEGSLKGEDTPAAFDVLWAIEANATFLAAEAEISVGKEGAGGGGAAAGDAAADVGFGKDEKKEYKKLKEKKEAGDLSKDQKARYKELKEKKKLCEEKEEEAAAKAKKDAKKDGGGGSGGGGSGGKAAPLSLEAILVRDFRKEVKAARELRKKTGLVEFQLTKMHDRLPPLSQFNRSFRLDEWQCRVLSLVDQDKSAVVCAPTSSGKTVISTYVAVKIAEEAKQSTQSGEGGVLFVVPSEPLVWQVAAMFDVMLPGQVALCTDLMAYRPESAFGQSNIVVGTPTALESALSKVRGLVGAERKKRGQDYAQMAGGFGFRYAVFDECHALDGDEGGALQRLMRLIECPFLALSATIGNGPSLRAFWTSVRQGHKDCIPALVNANAAVSSEGQGEGSALAQVRNPNVHLEVHEGRFINLQRLVLQPSKYGRQLAKTQAVAAVAAAAAAAAGGGEGGEKEEEEALFVKAEEMGRTVDLAPLHPCAAIDARTLKDKSFRELSIAFTPRDSFALWASLHKHVRDKASIAALDPSTFFAQFGDVTHHQITLGQAKEYEAALKTKLESMAKLEQPEDAEKGEVALVLSEFKVDEASSFTAASGGAALEAKDQLFSFALKCRDEQLFPCLCFQLDSFRCLEMYKELLGALEARQRLEFPNYYKELEEKAEAEERKASEAAKAAASSAKGKKSKDDDGDAEGPSGGAPAVGDEVVRTFIDTAAPHPSYVLSPPSKRISTIEFDDILAEMKKDKEPLPANHPLARGLRRGVGIYIDDVGMSVYRRVVQRLAQQGKLAIVFSDHSLAYGVNMPFRTCAFCGDMKGMLTPLMAQQMSGRTGRRGLDTQGNIVYLGMPWADIQGLILGQIPDIEGRDQRYPTMALQHVLSSHVDKRASQNAAKPTFHTFQLLEDTKGEEAGGGAAAAEEEEEKEGVAKGVDPTEAEAAALAKASATKAAAVDYYEMSSRLLQELGMVDEDMAPLVPETGLTTCWEMRADIAESLSTLHALPLLMQEFVVGKPKDYAEKVNVQVDFYARLLHFIDRQSPYTEADLGILGASGEATVEFAKTSFVARYAERQKAWDVWEAHCLKSQERLQNLPEDLKQDMEASGAMALCRLKIPIGQPIDATVFQCLSSNRLPLELPSNTKHDLKRRLFKVGTVVMKMHNCLMQPGEYQGLEPLLRKSFARLKYVLTDAIKNETSLQDQSGTKLTAAQELEAQQLAALVLATAAGGGGEEGGAASAAEVAIAAAAAAAEEDALLLQGDGETVIVEDGEE